jgi:hypothetical protein
MGWKDSSNASIFHVTESAAMKLLTWVGGLSFLLGIGRRRKSRGIQLSFHACVVVPVPILRINPCFIASLPSTKDRQTCDGWEPTDTSRKPVVGK